MANGINFNPLSIFGIASNWLARVHLPTTELGKIDECVKRHSILALRHLTDI